MKPLLHPIRTKRLLWLLAFVPLEAASGGGEGGVSTILYHP